MIYLLFSDIHGNLPAIERVLKKETHVDGYLNLGDVVNYGPWSNECVELLETLDNCYNIFGNHEGYYLEGSCDVQSDLVQSFFQHTHQHFQHRETIQKYKKSIVFSDFQLIHTLGEKQYIFRDTEVKPEQHTIIGHSHQQYIRYIEGKLLINPGSIGQNRKFINLSEYIIWDTKSGEFEQKKLSYNVDHLISEMIKEKYPKPCVDYYKNKNRY